jgi:ribosomal protein S18 acetylase RimI-like enzyme
MAPSTSPPTLTLKVIPKTITRSEYDWLNIFAGTVFVGKIRSKIEPQKLTIYTIMIFPEFQHSGYGEQVIDVIKRDYPTIIADRVRTTAIGFWEKMGFVKIADGLYEYRRHLPPQ